MPSTNRRLSALCTALHPLCMLAWSAMPCHTRTPGRLAARTLAPTAICHGLTAQRSDARTRAHSPAVYHACGWLWRAVAATMLAVAVIVACALLCLYPAAVSAGGDGLRYLQHIGGGASAAVSRSVYRSSGRWRAAFRGVCLLHLPAFSHFFRSF